MLKSFQAQQNRAAIPNPSERTLKVTMSTSSLYGTDVVVEEYRQLVDKIARHVVYGEQLPVSLSTTTMKQKSLIINLIKF